MKRKPLYWYVLMICLMMSQAMSSAVPVDQAVHHDNDQGIGWHMHLADHSDEPPFFNTDDNSAHCCHPASGAPCNGSAIVALATVTIPNDPMSTWNPSARAFLQSCWLDIEIPPPRLIL